MNQWQKNGGKCGLCGDPYQGPRDHEAGGIYATGTVGRCYPVGIGQVSVTIRLTAYHGGYFEFRLCAKDEPHSNITQSCLDQHVLTISGTGSVKYNINSIFLEHYVIKIDLPDGVSCKFCVLQWKYHAENSWGCDKSGCGIGRGHQEQFYNCADIAILPICPTYVTNLSHADATFETSIAQNAYHLQPGTYLETTGSKPLAKTICTGVGVWEHTSSMAAWCTQNCLGPTKYCPDNLCVCTQVQENATRGYQEYKTKDTAGGIANDTLHQVNAMQGDQTRPAKDLQTFRVDQVLKIPKALKKHNNFVPDQRRKMTNLSHFFYLFDPVVSGLAESSDVWFLGKLFMPSSKNNDFNGKDSFFQNHWKKYGGHCWLSKIHDETQGYIENFSNVTVLSGRCSPADNRQFEVEVRIKGSSGDFGWICDQSDCETVTESKMVSDQYADFTNCLHDDCNQHAALPMLKKDTFPISKDASKPLEMRRTSWSSSNIVLSRQTLGNMSKINGISRYILEMPVKPNVMQPKQESGKPLIANPLNSTPSHTHVAHQETTDPGLADSVQNEQLGDSYVCYGVGQWAGSKDMDDWCMFSCFHSDPYCPDEYCACSIADPILMGRNMNKKKTYCIATRITAPENDLTDWCNIGCNNNPPYCPSSLCLCE